MARKSIVEYNDLRKYFKGINLKGRLGVIESAKTLFEVQNGDTALLADDSPVLKKKRKRG
jgi:hypothetical protein